MHNLAIALSQKGVVVSGSDDEIFDPARTHLAQHGLLPPETGWHPERITPQLDAVVVGMHARADNPELLRAQQLGLRIYSYPEYLYEQSRDKVRIVVGGSHGKTTITAMVLHVLRACGVECDYMVGAQLQGFDVMVRLSDTARYMVIEGDEYLTSPVDPRPKFHLYHPHVAVLSGIEWDHINVFPSYENYKEQFRRYVQLVEKGGTVVYCGDDEAVCDVVQHVDRPDLTRVRYGVPPHRTVDGVTQLLLPDGTAVPLRVFGRHNLLNLMAARAVCQTVGVPDERFYDAISTFAGAGKRLERVGENGRRCAMYRDFAHAPSKLRATVEAMRTQYPDRRLVACMELHTFSSLTDAFLDHYRDTMRPADDALVYFSPHALELKRLPPLDPARVSAAFGGVEVYADRAQLLERLRALFGPDTHDQNLLMMSSGNFDGIDMTQLFGELLGSDASSSTPTPVLS